MATKAIPASTGTEKKSFRISTADMLAARRPFTLTFDGTVITYIQAAWSIGMCLVTSIVLQSSMRDFIRISANAEPWLAIYLGGMALLSLLDIHMSKEKSRGRLIEAGFFAISPQIYSLIYGATGKAANPAHFEWWFVGMVAFISFLVNSGQGKYMSRWWSNRRAAWKEAGEKRAEERRIAEEKAAAELAQFMKDHPEASQKDGGRQFFRRNPSRDQTETAAAKPPNA